MNTAILVLALAPGAGPIDDAVEAAWTAYEAARDETRMVAKVREELRRADAERGSVTGGVSPVQLERMEADLIRAIYKQQQLRKIKNIAVLVRVMIQGNTSNEPPWILYR